MTDMEGICGVVLPPDVNPAGQRYAMARRMITCEVNAISRGAVAAGADDILIVNGHGGNQAYDVLYDELEPPAQHIVGVPWGQFAPCLDDSVDCVFQIGAHAHSGTPQAFLEHTMSSAGWVRFTVNGRELGEIGLMGCVAGYHGAPVSLVTGDAAACAEARALFPGVVTVQTKQAFRRTAGALRPSPEVLSELQAAAEEAVKVRERVELLTAAKPCVLEVEYARTSWADGVKLGDGVERVNGRCIRVTGSDIRDAARRLF